VWWLVAGGWWLVAGGWWLVAGGWWLVAGGWWLVAGRIVWHAEGAFKDSAFSLLELLNVSKLF